MSLLMWHATLPRGAAWLGTPCSDLRPSALLGVATRHFIFCTSSLI
jgi:hypothetical protein